MINYFFYIVFIFILSTTSFSLANNLSVTNVTLAELNTTDGYAIVQFDISWENSWRHSINWDAAWVFVKYNYNGVWYHATLYSSGHTAPTGSTVDTPSDGTGIFIYRSDNTSGTFTKTGVQLKWNYGGDGLGDGDNVTIKVNAIEMVYVPEGSFYLGDGNGSSESGCSFHSGTSRNYVTINTGFTTNIRADAYAAGDEHMQAIGIGIDGDGGIDSDNDGSIDNSEFPTGYHAFYCMKYETTQEQYVDFLNMLTRAQQNTRTSTSLAEGTTSVTNRYVMGRAPTINNRNGIRCEATIHTSDPITFYCDYTGDGIGIDHIGDGHNIPCNFVFWADCAAYADWAGLRPMTELEYEKACRGNQLPVTGEYAWGTTSITYQYSDIWYQGRPDEYIQVAHSMGACLYYDNAYYDHRIRGPGRVGVFAGAGGNTRVTTGATYYGIMEMSGNLQDICVTTGRSEGRAFTGLHGNGVLSTDGNADVTGWPGTNASGTGARGGSWDTQKVYLTISTRGYSNYGFSSREGDKGFRVVRDAP